MLISKKSGALFLVSFLFLSSACSAPNQRDDVVKKEELFQKRFVYFDRNFAEEENSVKLKKIILDAKKLGFNGLVWSEEYLFSRLSHQSEGMQKIKKRFREIADFAKASGLEMIPMHFNPSIPTFVSKDSDPNNPFYQYQKFDFDEANRADATFVVKGDRAVIQNHKQSLTSANILDGMFYFKDIKPNTEYRLTLTISTKNFQKRLLKVSVLDSFDAGAAQILFGINQFFRDIKPNSINHQYHVYFNSLNHPNLNGKIKVYLPYQDQKGLTFSKLELEEVALVSDLTPTRKETLAIVKSADGKTVFKENSDYRVREERLELLSHNIKKEKRLQVSWFPKVNVARIHSQEPMADFCANPKLYIDIIKDQYNRIKETFGGVDGIAFNDDEWRTAAYNAKCKTLLDKEYKKYNKTGGFSGGDYIGIVTRKMIKEAINADHTKPVYLMSDMFDPNFNARNPYMGVKNGSIGSWDYLPKEAVVFNWFVNPKEPGLEEIPYQSFLKSLKHFSDHNISQIIAGYHDDMDNVATNIKVYKDSDAKTKKSIIGFMFLIWNQGGEKHATYADMPLVVKQICEQLPNKWPSEVCKKLK